MRTRHLGVIPVSIVTNRKALYRHHLYPWTFSYTHILTLELPFLRMVVTDWGMVIRMRKVKHLSYILFVSGGCILRRQRGWLLVAKPCTGFCSVYTNLLVTKSGIYSYRVFPPKTILYFMHTVRVYSCDLVLARLGRNVLITGIYTESIRSIGDFVSHGMHDRCHAQRFFIIDPEKNDKCFGKDVWMPKGNKSSNANGRCRYSHCPNQKLNYR